MKKKIEQKEQKSNYCALGICLGISIGMLFGLMMNNEPLYMSIGLCLGTAVGVSMEKKKK